jgi:hypothetical protein
LAQRRIFDSWLEAYIEILDAAGVPNIMVFPALCALALNRELPTLERVRAAFILHFATPTS